MDFKAARRARDAGKARNDVKARAAALRQKKLEEEAAARAKAAREKAKADAAFMPPPPPRPAAPKEVKKVTLAPAAAPKPAPSAELPAGFFDEAPAAAKPLVAYASDEEEEEEPAAPPPAPAPKSTPEPAPGSLPEGFFDDAAADLQARGIDPEKKKAKEEKAAWEEFQAFAGGVKETEAVEEAAEAEEVDDEGARRALDQAYYESRLAPLMARADGAKAETDAAPARLADAEATAASDVQGLMRAEKRRRKEAIKAAAERVLDLGDSDDDDYWMQRAIK